MQANLNIAYNDLVSIVKQLPLSDLKRLNYTINKLKAPTWTDKEYKEHQNIREHINKSRLS